jgi:hypothetical protein
MAQTPAEQYSRMWRKWRRVARAGEFLPAVAGKPHE